MMAIDLTVSNHTASEIWGLSHTYVRTVYFSALGPGALHKIDDESIVR